MQSVTVDGVNPYDGTYELDFGRMKASDYGLIKRLSGYLPLGIVEGLEGLDPELICAIAVVALKKAGSVADEQDARAAYDRLTDSELGAVKLNLDTEEEDAGPPDLSSNGNGDSSGPDSRTSSETSPPHLRVTGSQHSDGAALVRVRSVS